LRNPPGQNRYTRFRDPEIFGTATQQVINLWKSIVEDMKELGYEFHYFAFFRSADPRVQTFWSGRQKGDYRPIIMPTPQNFEAATILVDPEISDTVDNYIQTTSDISNDNVITQNGVRPGRAGRYGLGIDHFGTQIVGWRKRDLWNAIKATGLNKREIEPHPLAEKWNDLVNQLFTAEKRGKFEKRFRAKFYDEIRWIPRNINQYGRRFSKLADMFDRSHYSIKGIMPGINSDEPYMNKSYYEAIYRRIFNTMINVDWVQVCRENLVELPKLKQIAVSNFSFRPDFIEPLQFGQLCDLLEQESRRRRAIQEELMLGVPQAQEVVMYQPGGRLARQTEAEMIARYPGTFAEAAQQEKMISPQLQRLYAMCDDPNTTREQIFALAQEMDLEILLTRFPGAAPTKDDYCRILQNYLEQVGARSPL
jgi:hypothetical protein